MNKLNLFFLISFLVSLSAMTADKPNFIIILTDDQGYNDLSCFGSGKVSTPFIDSIANNGRKFTSFYVASPVCSPSRAALLTGCYPSRISMEKGVIFPASRHGLHQDEVTIADLLKGNSYATACVGKWHIGHKKPFLPTSQGFDYYFGIPYSNDMSHPDNKKKPKIHNNASWKNPESDLLWNTPLMINEEIVEVPVNQRTITRRYTDESIKFIEKNKDKPFFLYLAHSMPHIPLYVPEDVYNSNPKHAYKTVIEHIDTEVGRLLKSITELGLDDNTYVIFTSDNGPWLQYRNHAGSAKPLRSGKGSTYDGGQRVPCVMKGPGIPSGTVTDEILCAIDLLPTIAKLAGVEVKANGPIDGLDASQLMKGSQRSPRNEFLYYNPGGILQGLRQGDYKLRISKPRVKGKIQKNEPDIVELYNLKTDIGEEKNLAVMFPEKVDSMKQRLRAIHKNIMKNRRHKGFVK
ncbi:MAG: sulfatase [Lentisphaeraceae bacterium]|nr:sulfatase [Lentisphaeraceae bacterium]